MLCRVLSSKEIWSQRGQYHVLTYAEEGFAPLNQHTSDTDLSQADLKAFAKLINDLDQPGTLYPRVQLSAIPRRLIREPMGPSELSQSIQRFFQINAEKIRAEKLLLDFRTPRVSNWVYTALEMSLESPTVSFIDEIVVLDDDASHRPRHI